MNVNLSNAQIHNVKRNTPEYLRAESLKSSSASNEYFSDYATDALSQKSNESKASYETPPSRISTPLLLHAQPQPIDSEMTLPDRPGVTRPAPLTLRHTDLNRERTVRIVSQAGDASPPTPGVDDTPYIRFAIDQLTRDEDVLGRGRHSDGTPPPEPIPAPAVPSEPAESPIPSVPSPPPPTPPQEPERRKSTPIQRKPVPQEVMIPVDLSKDLRSRLGFVPTPLRVPFLVLYLCVCLLMLAALLFSLIFAARNNGLYDYDGNASATYFVFQYLPQICGLILIIWLFVIEAAIYRVLPFFCMLRNHPNQSVLQNTRILPANFVLPDFSLFRSGEPLLGVSLFVFWLANFTVPLLASLFQTQWVTVDDPARFRWTTVRGVGWTLVALYFLLVPAVVYCIIRFRTRSSALLWDPSSLADLICLFQRSNACADFEQTEVAQDLTAVIPPKQLRLGFWTTNGRPDVFHAVGEEYAPIKRLSWRASLSEKINIPGDGLLRQEEADVEAQRDSYNSNFTRTIHSPFVRYRYIVWFFRDSAVLAWLIAAMLLLIAFVVVSFVNNAVSAGFDPVLGSTTNSAGFSPADFVFSFVPSLLGMFCFLAWQPIDTYIRAVQPLTNLSSGSGATARRSLLLDYPAQGPGLVSFRALTNRDWKVAYVSFISLLSAVIPVLSGGVFTAQFFQADNEVRMVASMPGYYALCVVVAIYAFSYCIIWPKRKRYFPHSITTIAGLLSWLYASPLMGDGVVQNVRTKQDLIDRLTGSGDDGLTGEKRAHGEVRYAFGVFIGRDGKEHLGIDRLARPGSREMLMV